MKHAHNLHLVKSERVVKLFPHDPERRGLIVHYRGADTPCPGCGRTHWFVGRLSAECGFCTTAIPLGAGL